MSSPFFSEYRNIELKLMKELKTILDDSKIPYQNTMLENPNSDVVWSNLKLEYKNFLEKYDTPNNGNQISTLFLGMCPSWNPKNAIPFDYSQTNQEGNDLRKWLGVEQQGKAVSSVIKLKKPFWSLMQFACDSSDEFCKRCVVRNYCPFAFGKDGKDGEVDVSLTGLPKEDEEIKRICREAVVNFVKLLSKGRNKSLQIFILGNYDTNGIKDALKDSNMNVPPPVQILHPAARISSEVWKMEATWQMLKHGVFISLFPKSHFIKFCDQYCLSIVDAVNFTKKGDTGRDEEFIEYYTKHYTAIFGTFVEALRGEKKDTSVEEEKKDTSLGEEEQNISGGVEKQHKGEDVNKEMAKLGIN